MTEYLDHYNTERPHQGMANNVPDGPALPVVDVNSTAVPRISRRNRLGGLIHAYQLATS